VEEAVKKLIIGILAIFGLLSILAVLVVGVFGLAASLGRPGVPRATILEVDFQSGVIEVIPDDPFAQIMLEGRLELRDVVEALDRAAEDHRVEALVARIGGDTIPFAQIQEIRDAVARFRAAGKPAVAYAESFGHVGPGNGAYYLATAFDEIYLQPTGVVGLVGFMYYGRFVEGLFEKLDLEPQVAQRDEYKGGIETYTRSEFTPQQRESLLGVMNSRFDQIVRGISETRVIAEDEVRRLVDSGPLFADEALAAGLVDELVYRDEVYEKLREDVGDRSRLLYLQEYLERAGRPHRRGETVALIHGYGTIVSGPSGYSPLDGVVVLGSDSVSAAFRSAIDDSRVKAILFRVDSPGGSPLASDTIWRETIRARDAGKPVIVSMGNLAGSGGYMVAMHADKIVAQPGTVTASIGVYGGKLITTRLWKKLGITWDDVKSSENAGFWSTIHRFDEERFEASLDKIYDDFTSKVADGRALSMEQVVEVIGSRIWTGEQAKELGLIDELGGYDVALRLVRESLELEPDAALRIKKFPRPRSTLEMFVGRKPESSDQATRVALARAVQSLQPTVRLIKSLGLGEQAAWLTMIDDAGLN
jgi:protease-4